MFAFIKNLYEKTEPLNLENNFHPLVLNKALSMHRANLRLCDYMNRYSFYIPKKLWQIIVFYSIPKQRQPWNKYIKKKKEDSALSFWTDALKKYFNWSERELRQNISCIDEKTKKELAVKFGFDAKQFKALGLEFEKVKMKPVAQKASLDKWLG